MNRHDSAPAAHDPGLTMTEALTLPRPQTPRCNDCRHELSAEQVEELHASCWSLNWQVSCGACGWTGSLLAHTMGELLAEFGASSVNDLALRIGDIQSTAGNTFIDFDESTQDYVFGYQVQGIQLPFPIDPCELMKYMEEFDNDELASMAEEEAKEEADLAASAESGNRP